MTETVLLRAADPVKLKHGFLLLISVPSVLSVPAPAVYDRLHIELPVGAHKRSPRLFPDEPRSDLESGVLKGVIKHTRFHRGVELIDGSVSCHGFLEV